jgi:ribosomal protein S18 acetylase RimI-like enzyme
MCSFIVLKNGSGKTGAGKKSFRLYGKCAFKGFIVMPEQTLRNIVWNSLTDAHAQYAVGTERAKRYARGFSPLFGFADPQRGDLFALEPYCEPGEHLYCGGWHGPVPSGWQLDMETIAHQMVWAGTPPESDPALQAVRLGPEHLAEMLALVSLTQPGPFGERTVEMGEYYGVFEGRQLAAMAGERFQAGALREISAVCTHPDFQGRGLARRLMQKLIRIQHARGQTPFLHVMQENDTARRLYERIGFRHAQDSVVRVVTRL